MSVSQSHSFSQQPVLGWREVVTLPELNIPKIKAKIDTGARSSALHAYHLEYDSKQGEKWVYFWVHPYQRNTEITIEAEAKLLEMRNVRNSGGVAQLRPVIETVVKLGEREWLIELTLTNRDVMGFRMLLGRQAVRSLFLIDPGHSYLQSQPIETYSDEY
ncbi:ATP-dependent zinc protease [Euhalothece natronophila Z-M001]|uniref:ATP-dependent zinc protease n=1 Tax=Euhalothece natronophila Z-M001 TaxID=522448 RepID=A0A5B8NQW1_9CHRO|nr:ATP-dependent zinc protease [Euhalothece natronophila Z-M001]